MPKAKMSKQDLVLKLQREHNAELAEVIDSMTKLADILDDHETRINVMATQLAENNLRILFLMHKLKFKVQPQAQEGIILSDAASRQMVITGYEFYTRERPRFMADLEKDMKQAQAALEAAERKAAVTPDCIACRPGLACDDCYRAYLERVNGEDLPHRQGQAGSAGASPADDSGEPAASVEDSALPAKRSEPVH